MPLIRPCHADERTAISAIINAAEAYRVAGTSRTCQSMNWTGRLQVA